MKERRWHLGVAHRCQIKLVYLSEYAEYQLRLTELGGNPGAFAVGGDQPACSNPSNSPRLVNCSPRKLELYLFGMVLPSDQLPKTQRSASEKPRVDTIGNSRCQLVEEGPASKGVAVTWTALTGRKVQCEERQWHFPHKHPKGREPTMRKGSYSEELVNVAAMNTKEIDAPTAMLEASRRKEY